MALTTSVSMRMGRHRVLCEYGINPPNRLILEQHMLRNQRIDLPLLNLKWPKSTELTFSFGSINIDYICKLIYGYWLYENTKAQSDALKAYHIKTLKTYPLILHLCPELIAELHRAPFIIQHFNSVCIYPTMHIDKVQYRDIRILFGGKCTFPVRSPFNPTILQVILEDRAWERRHFMIISVDFG